MRGEVFKNDAFRLGAKMEKNVILSVIGLQFRCILDED